MTGVYSHANTFYDDSGTARLHMELLCKPCFSCVSGAVFRLFADPAPVKKERRHPLHQKVMTAGQKFLFYEIIGRSSTSAYCSC